MRVLSGIQPSGALHIGNYFGALRQFIDLQQRERRLLLRRQLPRADQRPRRRAAPRLHLRRDRRPCCRWGSTPRGPRCSCSRTCPRPPSWPGCCRRSRRWAGWRSASATRTRSSRGFRPSTGCSPTRCSRRPTSCSTTPTSCRSARTRSSTWRSPATSPSGSTRSIGGGEEVFRLPKPYILDSVAVVPGIDGRKMSKSYNNTIDIFDEPATIRKKVKKIVTDSTPVEAPKNPETVPAVQPVQAVRRRRRAGRGRAAIPRGGIGYGEVKTRLAEAMIARFAPAREQRAEWLAHPERIAESAPPRPSVRGPPPASSSTAPAGLRRGVRYRRG